MTKYGYDWEILKETGCLIMVVPKTLAEYHCCELKLFFRNRYRYLKKRFEERTRKSFGIFLFPFPMITKEVIVCEGGGCCSVNQKKEIEICLHYSQDHNYFCNNYSDATFQDVATNELVKGFFFAMLLRANSTRNPNYLLGKPDILWWFMEGAAAYFQGRTFDNYHVHEWAITLMNEGLMQEIENIVKSDFQSTLTRDDALFDLQYIRELGSFVGFLVERFGIKKFKSLFVSCSAQQNIVEETYNASLSTLEQNWLDYLRDYKKLLGSERTPDDINKIMDRIRILRKSCVNM